MPEQVVQQQCKQLGLPTVGGQCARLAATAEREQQPYLASLAALRAAELEDREQRAIARRLKDAHLPRLNARPRVFERRDLRNPLRKQARLYLFRDLQLLRRATLRLSWS